MSTQGKRIRLTDRRRQAVDGTIPYPGTVNQPDRQFKQQAQYDNWKEVINHPLPDMRTEWKENPRDDIGFGIPKAGGDTQPTVASVHVAADKAVRASVLLLGEKVAESIIEEQARDFMLMGGEALDRTLTRFSGTQELYAGDDEDEDDDAKEAADDSDDEEVTEAADDSDDEEDAKEASTELAVAASGAPVVIPAQPAESTGSQEGKQKGASAEDKFAADVQAKIAELKATEDARSANLEAYNRKVMEAAKQQFAGDSKEEDDNSKEATVATPAPAVAAPVAQTAGDIQFERVAGPNEMDIELTASMDSEIRPDSNADAMLASLFDDGTPTELPEPGMGRREASVKQGITSLGGQPKVASAHFASGQADISSIWDSAPDVSEIFN